jgi:dienelactone hydrolase
MMTDRKGGQSGLRGVLYLFGVMALTALVVVFQIKYRGFEGPLSDYILIIILITANYLLLAAVIFMTARSLWKLSIERKHGVLGAKFRTKLVAAFVSLSFIPPILLFLIGTGMFTSSIERLFSLKIENSLKDSVNLAQAYFDRLDEEAFFFGRQISRQLTEERLLSRFENPVIKEYLAKKAAEYGLGSVELFVAPRERAITVVTGKFPSRTFVVTSSDLAARAFAAQEEGTVLDLGKKGEIVRAVVPVYASLEGKDVEAAVAAAGDAGPVAVLGYCWGGTLAFLAAARLPGIACAVGYYGGQTAPFAHEKVKVPVLLHFGALDPRTPPDYIDAIRRHNPQIEIHMFPADHGFNCDHRKEWHEPSARRALELTLAFLESHMPTV